MEFTENELFMLLGNGTRMKILRTLWDEFEIQAYMTGSQSPLSFSEIRSRAAVSDSGNFNYHLDRLGDTFLEQVEDGYVLSPLGFRIMQSLEGHADFVERTIEPTELSTPCPFCASALLASYEREILRISCSTCEALGAGNVHLVRCPVTSISTDELTELIEMSVLRLLMQVNATRHGFCPACYSEVELSLSYCPDHETPHCDCGRRSPIGYDVHCTSCRAGGSGPLIEQVFADPSTIGHFERHGLGPKTAGLWEYRVEFLERLDERITTAEPIEVSYEITIDDDESRVVATETDAGLTLSGLTER
jgi:hypothetical protein